MFKVIESDEEFEAALVAGLLWINTSSGIPRTQTEWMHVRQEDRTWAARMRVCANPPPSDAVCYMPEDFAVLVEDVGDGDG